MLNIRRSFCHWIAGVVLLSGCGTERAPEAVPQEAVDMQPAASSVPAAESEESQLAGHWQYVMEHGVKTIKTAETTEIDLQADGAFSSSTMSIFSGTVPTPDGVVSFSSEGTISRAGSWTSSEDELVLTYEDARYEITSPADVDFSIELSEAALKMIEENPDVTKESVTRFREDVIRRSADRFLEGQRGNAAERFVLVEVTGDQIETMLIDEATDESPEERIPVTWRRP